MTLSCVCDVICSLWPHDRWNSLNWNNLQKKLNLWRWLIFKVKRFKCYNFSKCSVMITCKQKRLSYCRHHHDLGVLRVYMKALGTHVCTAAATQTWSITSIRNSFMMCSTYHEAMTSTWIPRSAPFSGLSSLQAQVSPLWNVVDVTSPSQPLSAGWERNHGSV